MPDQEIKTAIRYRLNTIRIGEIFHYPGEGFYLFQQGSMIGAAISTGETLLNVHNVRPTRAFTMDAVCNLLGVPGNFLTMTASSAEIDLSNPILANRFADIICQFVRTEDDNRTILLEDPIVWAEQMIATLGNDEEKDRVYAYIAELDVVKRLCEAGLMTNIAEQYRGPDKSVHDFEMPDFSLEVKSHLYGSMNEKANTITISSEHQLELTEGKPLYVVYYRMEETGTMSLESEVDALVNMGKSKPEILAKIKKSGYTEGDLFWRNVFHTQNEPQVYAVCGEFPRITPQMFHNDHFPTGIVKLVYTISLANIPSCGLTEFIRAKCEGREPRFVANFNPGVM